jgi:tRNA(fMet)-specific endonuclease VapC
VLLSVLSLAELQRGAYLDPDLTVIRQARLEVLLRGLPVLPFDALAALAYGRIIAQCGWARGRDYHRMIAAHAISSDSIPVTNNKADFRDIPGLSMENWPWKTGHGKLAMENWPWKTGHGKLAMENWVV